MKIPRFKAHVILLISIVLIFCEIAVGKQNEPIKINFGLLIKRVFPDFRQSTFHGEFYWWATFKNDSVKSGLSNKDVLGLEYVNGVNLEANAFSNEVVENKEIAPNTFYVSGSHQGDFYFSSDFRMYPFDQQRMDIKIENVILTEDEIILLPDTASYIKSKQERKFWGMSNDILKANDNSNFHIFKTATASGKGIYNSDFGDESLPKISTYGRLQYSVFIDRSFLPYVSKFIIPLMIILLLVYFVFYLPQAKIDIAAALTVTSLLSAISFQSSINNDLPEIGYIIYIDKLFFTCYALIAISMLASLVLYYLDNTGDPRKIRLAKKITMALRIVFPFVFILAAVLFAL